MKRFIQFISEARAPKEEHIFNSHGTHAFKFKPHNPYYGRKRKRFSLIEGSDHPSLETEYLNLDKDSKYSTSKKDTDSEKRINELHDQHEHTDQGKLYHKQFTQDSTNFTEDLLHNHVYKTPLKYEDFVKGIDKHGFVPAKKNFESYSGVGFNLKNVKPVGKSKNGNPVYPQPTYMSSSVNKNVANGFAEIGGNKKNLPDRHIFHWHHEEHQPVAVIGNHSEYPLEKEVLIPRTGSTKQKYHIEHTGTDTYMNQFGMLTHVHHVRRIPQSEIVKGK